MIILGIDPGSRTTGYGLIKKDGRNLIHVDNGIISPPGKKPLSEKLQLISQRLVEIIKEYKPTVAAIEEVFVANNARSALLLGHARGVAMLAAANAGLEVYEYSARTVKQALVGYGNADKNQVAQMVKITLKLPEVAAEDAADALAVAICHAQTRLPRA